MAGLSQLLKYLDRTDVEELILQTGKAVTARVAGQLRPIGAMPVSAQQMDAILAQPEFAGLRDTGRAEPFTLDGKGVLVTLMRRPGIVMLRLTRDPQATQRSMPSAPPPAAYRTPVPPAPQITRTPTPIPARPNSSPISRPATQPASPFPQQASQPLGVPSPSDIMASQEEGEAPSDSDTPDDLHAEWGITAPTPEPLPRAPSNTPLAVAAPAPTAPPTFIAPVPQVAPAPEHVSNLAAPVPVPASAPPITSESRLSIADLIAKQPWAPTAFAPRFAPAILHLFQAARQKNASDLHIIADRPPMARLVGQMTPLGAPLTAQQVETVLLPLLDERSAQQLRELGYADLAFDVPGAGRMRANINRQKTGLKGCFRLIADKPPVLEDLGLPPELAKVTTYHQGLAIVSGPNGHGKTTTMAALVNLLNHTKAAHIITVEDPVEIIHPIKKSVISQRQVGTHTNTFAAALKGALREDPDVIVIGELRDVETVEMALSAAETGHLVIATMSTPSGAKTIDRLIDMFPPEDQSQVRATLAGALKIIVSQRLVPSADGSRLVAAAELITGNFPLWNLIREDKLFQLPSLLQRGRAFGMIRIEDSLRALIDSRIITLEAALRVASDPKALQATMAAPAPTAAKPGRPFFGKGS